MNIDLNNKTEVINFAIANKIDKISGELKNHLEGIRLKEEEKFFRNHIRNDENLNKFNERVKRRMVAEEKEFIGKKRKEVQVLRNILNKK